MAIRVSLICVGLLLLGAGLVDAKDEPGDSCSSAEDHCGAPKSKLGCCYSNTACYAMDDCATYLKGCPFSHDGKGADNLGSCLPDKTSFSATKCAASVASSKPGMTAKCFQSNNVTCTIFTNATAKIVNAACKPNATYKALSSSAHAAGSSALMVTGALLLAALLVL